MLCDATCCNGTWTMVMEKYTVKTKMEKTNLNLIKNFNKPVTALQGS